MVDILDMTKGIYDAFGRGDIPAILDALAPDVAWESWADNSSAAAGVPWMQPRHGRDGAAAFFGLLGTELLVHDFRVLSLMASEQQVAAEFTIEIEVPSTGARYRDEEMHLWTFNAEGKVSRLRHYSDTAKHIRGAGRS